MADIAFIRCTFLGRDSCEFYIYILFCSDLFFFQCLKSCFGPELRITIYVSGNDVFTGDWFI